MTTPMTDEVALATLGISRPFHELDAGGLKKGYRKAALGSHPDSPGGDEEKFKLVAQAAEFLQKRLSGEIPAATRAPDPEAPDPFADFKSGRRGGAVWTKQHTQAADAINFDDLLDDLRVATAPKPLVQFLSNGEVLVTQIPPGGAVSFDMAKGAEVYGSDGNPVECDRQILGAEKVSRMQDFVDELRRCDG